MAPRNVWDVLGHRQPDSGRPQKSRRQIVPGYPENTSSNWWFTSTGYVVRYVIVVGLLLLALALILAAYAHAQRRIRLGKPPLAYHRWMVKRNPPRPPLRRPGFYNPGSDDPNAYPMHVYPPPPPAYNPQEPPPPVYHPPEGATKAMPDQNYGREDEDSGGSGSAAAAPAPRE